MSGLVAVAALGAGLVVYLVAARVASPRRPLGGRIGLYTETARTRLGAPVQLTPRPLVFGEALRKVLGPAATAAGQRTASRLRLGSDEEISLAVRQSGLTVKDRANRQARPMSVEDYRRRHLTHMVVVPIVFVGIGYLRGLSVVWVLAMAAAGIWVGARWLPNRTARAVEARNIRVRSDLESVTQMLAIYVQAGRSLHSSVAAVAAAGSGPVCDDLRRALALQAEGFGEPEAYTFLASESDGRPAEFWRALATAANGSVDLPSNLVKLGAALRDSHREDVLRRASKAQEAMLVPIVIFMAPVVLFWIGLPIPSLIFGR